MKKKSLILKYIMIQLVIFIATIGFTTQRYEAVSKEGHLNNESIEKQALINNAKPILGANNRSLGNIPDIKYGTDIEEIEVINTELRNKYLNRSELYKTPEGSVSLEQIDQQFITAATEDTLLYAHFTPENFGIKTEDFIQYNDSVFESLLKRTEYGIDHGYFLGSQSPNPLVSEIQIELSVPKGTKMIRVGSWSEPQFILPRESTFCYKKIELKKTEEGTSYVKIKAELVDRSVLTNKTIAETKLITDSIQGDYQLHLKLEPLGLNAGLIFSQSQAVVRKTLNSLTPGGFLISSYFDDWELTITNGWQVHTTFFEKLVNTNDVDLRREWFDLLYKSDKSEVGITNHLLGNSETALNLSGHQNPNAFKENIVTEEFSSTILHEFFHHLIWITEYFKSYPLYRNSLDSETDFNNYMQVLKGNEVEKLVRLISSEYPRKDPLEFICEAFATSIHPHQTFKAGFSNEMVLTNRFLNNLFDFNPPSVPQNLRGLEVSGNSIRFTFDHSVDEISVDKYAVYQNGQQLSLIDTAKDNHGLSFPRPEDHTAPMKILIEGLAQATEYEFQVSAIDEAGNESEKSEPLKIKTKDTEPPKLQGNLQGKRLASQMGLLNWEHPTDNVGVTLAKIVRKESSSKFIKGIGDNFLKMEKIFTVSGEINHFTDTTIERGKTYIYSMTALDAAGNESDRSNEIILTASDDDDRKRNEDKAENTTSNGSTLNWSGQFGGISAAGFQIFGWMSGATGWLAGAVTSVGAGLTSSAVSLTPGMLHMFVVIPVDNLGNPLNSGLEISIEAPPKDVTGLKIMDTKQTLVTIEWQNTNSSGEFREELVHDIYRDGRLVATVSGQTTSFTDRRLTPETNYEYQVFARVGDSNRSLHSEGTKATTKAPYFDQLIRFSSLSHPDAVLSHGTGDQVILEQFMNEEPQFININYDKEQQAYQLMNTQTGKVWGMDSKESKQVSLSENKKEKNQYWFLIDNLDGSVSLENKFYTNKAITVGDPIIIDSSWTVLLLDQDEALSTQKFKVLIDTEAPTAPTNLSMVNITENSLDLTWEAATDNVGVIGYEIYQEGQLINRVSKSTLTYKVTGLTPATSYRFSVKAIDGSGNVSQGNNEVAGITLPRPPKNLTGSNITESSVNLSWEAGETSSLVSGYEIFQDGQSVKTVDKNILNAKIENLKSMNIHNFTVKTKAGNALSIATKNLAIETLPKTPKNLKASNINENTLELSWESEENSLYVKGFELYQGKTQIADVDRFSKSYQVGNLSSGTTYDFTVKTKTSNNTSLASEVLFVTTLPRPPKNLKASNITESSVNLSWEVGENSSLVTGYEIFQNGQSIKTFGKNTLSHRVDNLKGGTRYDFVVVTKIMDISSSKTVVSITTLLDKWSIAQAHNNSSLIASTAPGITKNFYDSILFKNVRSVIGDIIVSYRVEFSGKNANGNPHSFDSTRPRSNFETDGSQRINFLEHNQGRGIGLVYGGYLNIYANTKDGREILVYHKSDY